jgi:chromosome segregation ATPase
MRRLVDEKNTAVREYERKINGQEREIASCQEQREDIKRSLHNRETEHVDLKAKIEASRGKIRDSEEEYAQHRNTNNEIVRANKQTKQELGIIQASLKHEQDIHADNVYRLDSIKQALMAGAEERQWQST